MRKRELILSSICGVAFASVCGGLLWLAYVTNVGVENLRSKQEGFMEVARRIDRAAGLPEGASQSASAFAHIVKLGNDEQASHVRVYISVSVPLLLIAIIQFVIVLRAYREDDVSNHKIERDTRRNSARPSL